MKIRFQQHIRQVLFFGTLGFAFSCSNTKYLKEGEMLYTGAEVKIENDSLSKKSKKALKSELEDNLTPKPNSSFLGLRPKLFFYNIAKEPKKEKGFNYWLKYKIGEKPVLLSDVDREFNKDIIVNYSALDLTLPFYLRRPVVIASYRGELAMGSEYEDSKKYFMDQKEFLDTLGSGKKVLFVAKYKRVKNLEKQFPGHIRILKCQNDRCLLSNY